VDERERRVDEREPCADEGEPRVDEREPCVDEREPCADGRERRVVPPSPFAREQDGRAAEPLSCRLCESRLRLRGVRATPLSNTADSQAFPRHALQDIVDILVSNARSLGYLSALHSTTTLRP
jgi:hypothetical protein